MPTALTTLRLSFIAAGFSLLATLPCGAQQERARVSERLRHKDRLVAIELPASAVAAELAVQVRSARAARLATPALPANVSVERAPAPVLPTPLPRPTIDRIASALGGGIEPGPSNVQNAGPPVLDRIKLSARRPWFNERGNVEFVLPYEVNPELPSVTFNKNFPGLLRVNLKLEAGRSYLVDFAVSSWGAGSYRVEAGGATQEFGDPQGNLEHVLIALQASQDGWTTIDLKREGTGYYLYTVTTDRVD